MHFVHIVSSKHKQYYYNNAHNEPVGPLTIDQIQKLVELGRIGQHTWIIERNGMEWKKLSELFPRPAFNPRLDIPSQSERQTAVQPPAQEPVARQPSQDSEQLQIPKPPFVAAQPQPIQKIIEPPSIFQKQIPILQTPLPIPSETSDNFNEKLRFISQINLLSGVSNILMGFLWIGLGSIFSSINFFLTLPPALYCILTGVLEITFSSKIRARQICSLKHARMLALMSIFSFVCGNIISGILSIINMLNFDDAEARIFFEPNS